MTETLKILGQGIPSGGMLADLYVVPADTQASGSSLAICNQSSVRALFRVSVARGGAADAARQYLFYDVPVDGNRTYVATIGLALNAGDVVRVRSSNGFVSFNLFGVEVVT